MAAKKKAAKGAAKAGGAAVAVKDSPYVQRIIEDEDLRQSVVDAFDSARSAYSRLSNGRASATSQIFDDKKLQKDLSEAATSFRDASVALREAPKDQGGGFGKLLLLVLVGGIAAVALSEGLRKKLLDALFGAEEEFEYTSATTPAPGDAGTTGTASTPTTPAAATPSATPGATDATGT